MVYKRFVRTSETQDKRQPDLFDEAGEKDETGKEDEAEKETIPYQRNKHKAGRKPLPENLTREEHINDLPEEEKTCSCGARLKRIGENVNEKLIIEEPGIYAERTVTPKRNGTRTTYNKKGSPENPRLRVTMPSDLTLKRLAEYIAAHPCNENDFIFSESDGRPITQDRAQYIFEQALETADIKRENRKIVCHSLRYTYVTRMRRESPVETVQKMVGHIRAEQTDYYTNRRALDESIAGLIDANSAADNLFT